MIKVVFFIIAMLVSLSSQAWGTTYYVSSSTGDDTRTSLQAQNPSTPWAHSPHMGGATSNAASTVLLTGDTVYFNHGDSWDVPANEHSNGITIDSGVTYDGVTWGSGANRRATLTGTNAHVMGMVNIFTGSSGVVIKGIVIDGGSFAGHGISAGYQSTANIDGITIDDVEIKNIGAAGDCGFGTAYGLIVSNSEGYAIKNVTITNTSVHDITVEGLIAYVSWKNAGSYIDGMTVRNCSIYNTGMCGDKTRGLGIGVANDARNVTFEFNNVYANGAGFLMNNSPAPDCAFDSCGGPTNLVLRYNLIHDNTGYGIRIANNAKGASYTGNIYGNLIWSNGASGGSTCPEIYIGGTEYFSSVINFYNNTIDSTANGCNSPYGVAFLSDGTFSGTPTFNFKNNVVKQKNAVYAVYDPPQWLLTNHDYNLYYRADSGNTIYSGTTAYTLPNVTNWETTAQKTDPTFTGGTLPTGFSGTYGVNMLPNTTYFAIASGDAIGNGATLGSPYNSAINYAGVATPLTRPAGAYDIGAYQYTGVGAYPASSGGKFIGGLLIQ